MAAPAKNLFLLAFFLCAVVFVFYLNGIWAPFAFDEYSYVVENPSIYHLWPIWRLIAPPHTHTHPQDFGWNHSLQVYAGRPLINLSFAINYALGGMGFAGFHLWNIGVHVAATLVLFGIVRRTLLLPRLKPRFGQHASGLAAAAALLWAVHPLQTESVTYIMQRAESMAGLFYLLTLYCFIRGAEAGAAGVRVWFSFSSLACLAGVGCKETIVTAPVIVFLYDGIFLASGFREAWMRRWKVYVGLLFSWILLGYLSIDLAGHGGLEGFKHGMSGWDYLRIQCWAIVHYLKLTFWPHPLILDYGWAHVDTLRRVWPQALILVTLVITSAWGVGRRSPLGFLGAWFFIILAPSSSIIPIPTQTIAEHRIYLSLASVSVLVVLGAFLVMEKRSLLVYWVVIAGLVGELGFATIRRNGQYQDPVLLWKDAAIYFPNNPRIDYNIGHGYWMENKPDQALIYLQKAVALDENFDLGYYALGQLLVKQGKTEEGIEQFKIATRLSPTNIIPQLRLIEVFESLHQPEKALPYVKKALQIDPLDPRAKFWNAKIEGELKQKNP